MNYIDVIHLPPPNTTNPTSIDSIEKGIRRRQVNYINMIYLPPPNTRQSTNNGMSIESMNVIHLPSPYTTNPTPIDSIKKGIRGGK